MHVRCIQSFVCPTGTAVGETLTEGRVEPYLFFSFDICSFETGVLVGVM